MLLPRNETRLALLQLEKDRMKSSRSPGTKGSETSLYLFGIIDWSGALAGPEYEMNCTVLPVYLTFVCRGMVARDLFHGFQFYIASLITGPGRNCNR